MAKKNRMSPFSVVVLIFSLLSVALFGVFLVYGIWMTSVYSNLRVPFPEGTQIIQETDTHRGFFRSKGIAVVVAYIPENYMQEFGNRLEVKGFAEGPPVGPARELLSAVEEVRYILDSSNTMVNYEDEALALVERPFSDCSAAIYDLDTGVFCYVEYDE